MRRYSAKLLYKYSGIAKEHGRWLVEARIVSFRASDNERAYAKACAIGEESCAQGVSFLGVVSMICCDLILEKNEVLYELSTSEKPENRIPDKEIVLSRI